MTRAARGLAGALVAGLALSGCAFSGSADRRINQSAPETAGIDEDGQEFRLADYRGKVVLLDFWFST